MKRKPVTSYLLATVVLASVSRAGAQPVDEAVVPAKERGNVSVDEARAEYRRAEENVASLQAAEQSTSANNESRAADQESLREKLRPVVMESFIARQRLQRAELDELRRRLAGIEQSLAEREKRMTSIVDSRVDELLSGRTDEPVTPVAGSDMRTTPSRVDAKNHGPRSADEFELETRQQLAQVDLQFAQEKYDVAVEVLKRLERLHAAGTVDESAIATHQIDLREAKVQVARAKIKVDGLARDLAKEEAKQRTFESVSRSRPVDSLDPFDFQTRERLAQSEVAEAEAIRDEAQHRFDAHFDANKKARGSEPLTELIILKDKLRAAEAGLQRAKVKWEGLKTERTELEADAQAAVVEAEAERHKAAAKVRRAMANRDALAAEVQKAEADLHAAVAKVGAQLVDERKDALNADQGAVTAAKSALAIVKAHLQASEAAIDETRADVDIAEARLKAANARRERVLHDGGDGIKPAEQVDPVNNKETNNLVPEAPKQETQP